MTLALKTGYTSRSIDVGREVNVMTPAMQITRLYLQVDNGRRSTACTYEMVTVSFPLQDKREKIVVVEPQLGLE